MLPRALRHWLEGSDLSLQEGDLAALSKVVDMGWDEVSVDVGDEIMRQYESNFEQVPCEEDFEIGTFDDYGLDDLGDAFDSFDLDFDW